MAYTSPELVRRHLASYPVSTRVYDQSLVFENDEYLAFFGGAVQEGTVLVKSIQSHQPTRSEFVVSAPTLVLDSSPLVPGSVVVASDASLGTVYMENVDYAADYAQGKLFVKGGGNLQTGQTITLWYQPYALYVEGVDYRVEPERGRIKRLVSGNIGVGETVYLDYAPVSGGYSDELVNTAVAEANGLVERAVDPDRRFGADPILQLAATYRALEIICRSSAIRILGSTPGSAKTAVAWMHLADVFADRANDHLSAYRPVFDGPNPPAHT